MHPAHRTVRRFHVRGKQRGHVKEPAGLGAGLRLRRRVQQLIQILLKAVLGARGSLASTRAPRRLKPFAGLISYSVDTVRREGSATHVPAAAVLRLDAAHRGRRGVDDVFFHRAEDHLVAARGRVEGGDDRRLLLVKAVLRIEEAGTALDKVTAEHQVNIIAIVLVVVVVLLAFAAAEELKFRAVDEWSRQLVELFSLLLNLAIAAQSEGTMKISQNRFL